MKENAMKTTTRKTKVKVTEPKFRMNQRVKWTECGVTYYGRIGMNATDIQRPGSEWTYSVYPEDGAEPFARHESALEAAHRTPERAVKDCMAEAAEELTHALTTARRTLTTCTARLTAAGWYAGDLFAAYAEEAAHAGKIDALLAPAVEFLRREDKTDDEKRAALRREAEKAMTHILTRHDYRHNCTAEYQSILNRAHFKAKQDAYQVLAGVVHDLDRAAAYREQVAAGALESTPVDIARLPGRSW